MQRDYTLQNRYRPIATWKEDKVMGYEKQKKLVQQHRESQWDRDEWTMGETGHRQSVKVIRKGKNIFVCSAMLFYSVEGGGTLIK